MSSSRQVRVAAWPLPAGQSIATHRHDVHQLSLASRSTIAIGAGGRVWVVPRGRALWIPAGVDHSIHPIGVAEMTAAWIEPRGCPLRWTEPTVVAVDELARRLVDRLVGGEVDGAARSRTEAVLFDVLVPAEMGEFDLALPSDDRARVVAEALLADPSDARTLASWGRATGASDRTLMRAFRSGTGLTFHEWRTRSRVLAAVRLLIEGEPVSVIAGRVGFATTSAFSAAFSRVVGVPPSLYRGRTPA